MLLQHYKVSRLLAPTGGLLCLLLIVAPALAVTPAAGDRSPPLKALVIYSYDDSLPWQRRVRQGLLTRRSEQVGAVPVTLFEERLDSIRLGRLGDDHLWGEHLRRKYANVALDKVVTEGEDAARLLVEHPQLFGHARRYLVNPGGVVPSRSGESLVPVEEDAERSLRTALALSPQARRVVVVGSLRASQIERLRLERLRAAWEKHFRQRVSFEAWTDDFSFDELYTRASALPRDTVLLYALVTRDRTGASAAPYAVMEQLTARASVPVFATHNSLIGSGTVGGYLLSAERIGWAIADVLGGASPETFAKTAYAGDEFDSRALQRWGIADALLPPGSVVHFRDPSFWDQHRIVILYGVPVILIETLLLLFLARALRARRLSMQELEEERRQVEQRVAERTVDLARSEAKYRALFETANDGIFLLDDTGFIDCNQRGAEMYGCARADVIGHAPEQFAPERQPDGRLSSEVAAEKIGAALQGQPQRFEWHTVRPDGMHLDVEITLSAIQLGEARCLQSIVRDIGERKRAQQQLEQQAHVDYLTGLCNRGHFMQLAEMELSRAIRYEKSLSIFMLDVDFFKQVNDRHGHKVGDKVLQALADVCLHTLRAVDIIGRVGGEEFAMLLPETAIDEAFEVAERLRLVTANTKVPMDSGLPIEFTVSIGVAALAERSDNLDVLLNRADTALYQAKNAGRNRVCAEVPGLMHCS